MMNQRRFRYQIGLEIPMKGSDFIIYCVHLLIKRLESYIDSSDQVKNKKATIIPSKKIINAFNML